VEILQAVFAFTVTVFVIHHEQNRRNDIETCADIELFTILHSRVTLGNGRVLIVNN